MLELTRDGDRYNARARSKHEVKGTAMLTYKQKHEQANREALATVVALLVTVIVWIACGFGLAGFDITVFHTPLWVIGGTIGTWICSIVVVVALAKKVFVGFDLDDELAGPDAVKGAGNE